MFLLVCFHVLLVTLTDISPHIKKALTHLWRVFRREKAKGFKSFFTYADSKVAGCLLHFMGEALFSIKHSVYILSTVCVVIF